MNRKLKTYRFSNTSLPSYDKHMIFKIFLLKKGGQLQKHKFAMKFKKKQKKKERNSKNKFYFAINFPIHKP